MEYPLFPFVKVHNTMGYKTSMPRASPGTNPSVNKMLTEEVGLVDGIILIAGRSLDRWSANSFSKDHSLTSFNSFATFR
jgi:hypothetical protein